MPEHITVSTSLFCAHFFDIQAGTEEIALSHLREKGFQNIYKALGTYDLVTFSGVEAMDHPVLYQSIPQAHSSCTVTGYRFRTVGYNTPALGALSGDLT